MNKMNVYIEFNGVAGSGKSTISHQLHKVFKSSNIPVVSYQQLFDEYVENSLWKTKTLILLFSLDGLKLAWNTIQIIRILKIPINKLKFVPYMILTQLLINHFKTNGKVIISDEGVIQYLVSVLFDRKIDTLDFEIYLKNILKILSNNSCFISINLHLNSSQILSRLSKRKDGCSRLDNISNSKRKRITSIQINNFKIIRKSIKDIPHIDINAKNKIDYNANLILDILKREYGVCCIEKYYK